MMEEQIKLWYAWGFWTADMVREAVPDLLTQAQAEEILTDGTSGNEPRGGDRP